MIRLTTFGDLRIGDKFATLPVSYEVRGEKVDLPSEIYTKIADHDADETCFANAKRPRVSFGNGGGAIFWKSAEVVAL